MKKIYLILCLACTGILTGLIKTNMNPVKKTHKAAPTIPHQQPTPVITVWIHGTSLLSKKMFKNLFFSYPGLRTADSYEPRYHKKTIAKTLNALNPKLFPWEHFYIFGWSGKLNFAARTEAAKELYHQLKRLVEHFYQKHHIIPKIRLITHSHGGNVALSLVEHKETDVPFVINELVLLACPVQEKTKVYTNDPFFEQIYSLYSPLDMVQIADPQGLYKENHNKTPLFSQRHFPHGGKVAQIQVTYANRGLLHLEFIFSPFLTYIPTLLTILENKTLCQAGNHYKATLRPNPCTHPADILWEVKA